MLKVSVIGAGVFGGYHAQKAVAAPDVDFVGVFDPDGARCGALAKKMNVHAFRDMDEAIAGVDAVVIATPATTHAEIVRRALESHRHVLVEKPLALDAETAMDLAEVAQSKGLVLQVGHQERLVSTAMGLLDIDQRPELLSAQRQGTPSDRALDVSVVDDLMIHDIDLALRLTGDRQIEAEDVMWTGDDNRIDAVFVRGALGSTDCVLFADRRATDRNRTMKLKYASGLIEVDFVSRHLSNTTPFAVSLEISDQMPDPLQAADERFYAACLGTGTVLVSGFEAADAVACAAIIRDRCTPDTFVPREALQDAVQHVREFQSTTHSV